MIYLTLNNMYTLCTCTLLHVFTCKSVRIYVCVILQHKHHQPDGGVQECRFSRKEEDKLSNHCMRAKSPGKLEIAGLSHG